VFFSHGHKELDAARNYGDGTTEKYLSLLDLKGATVDTKIYPNTPGDHAPAILRSNVKISVQTLGKNKIRVLYLHAPDRKVPFEETCRELNKLHEEGLFEIFGLSNFSCWEVAEIVQICKYNGWLQPKIYQAMYNALQRAIEPELVPCLRKFGIRLVVYNPLAGGLLAGKILSVNDLPAEGRFSGDSSFAKMYRERYIKDAYLTALKEIKAVADKNGLTMVEVALRWCQHHSLLIPTDGIILGASSAAQLEANCKASEGGPLPQEILDALDNGWLSVSASAPLYWR